MLNKFQACWTQKEPYWDIIKFLKQRGNIENSKKKSAFSGTRNPQHETNFSTETIEVRGNGMIYLKYWEKKKKRPAKNSISDKKYPSKLKVKLRHF